MDRTEKDNIFMDADEVAQFLECKKYYAYRVIKKLNEQMLAEFPGSIVVKGKVNRKYFIQCVDPLSAENDRNDMGACTSGRECPENDTGIS